mgnify:CR=1 FL=1
MLPNGIVETRTYDNADRLTRIHSTLGMSTVEDLQYTLDGVGNPLTLTTPSRTESYSYEEMKQLEHACFESSCPVPEVEQVGFT